MTSLEKLLEDPVRFRRVRRGVYAGLVALVLAEAAAPFLLYSDHGHFAFEDLPAWGALYGLVSSVAIVVVSKVLGKLWLMRRETYYDS
jgi:hypothetical protein